MYSKKDICAVVITYNCDDVIENNIKSLVNQVADIIIYDNGSTNNSCSLKKMEKMPKVNIVYNQKNEGISVRLNEALNYCRLNGFQLLITMDQDTVLADDCVEKLLNVMNSDDDIASVGPNRGLHKKNINDIRKDVNYVITSGNLVRVDKAIECGGYLNELFIDMIDVDFSLALRCKGYRVVVAYDALMLHEVGVESKRKVLWMNVSYYTHSANRFYYMYRNRVIVYHRYFKQFPITILKWYLINIYDLLKIVIMEYDKRNKLKMSVKGLRDGCKWIKEDNE